MSLFKGKIFWVIIIFFSAAAFRLTNMDLVEFKLDEARDVYEMVNFYSHPYFIQRGTIQSTGVYNPPLWYYILALVALPSRDPQYLSFVIAFINCLAVVGFYLVVRRFYGQFVGVASGLLLAFSPWAILFSRKIWAPDMILPFLVPLFYFLHKKNAFWVVLLLSLLVQLHASGIFLGLASIVAIIVSRVKVNLKYTLLGLVISLIPFLPYLAYQFQTGCSDCQAFFTYQQGEALGATPTFDPNVFLRPFQFINGSGFANVLGEEVLGVFNMIFLLEFALGILGIVYLVSPPGSPSPPRRWRWGLIAILGMVPLLYLISQTPAHMHYFIILSPIMMVIYALGIVHLGKVFHLEGVKAHLPGGVVITVIIIINIIFELSFYKFLSEKQNMVGDYGSTFKLTAQTAEEKIAKYKDSPDYELIRAEFWVKLFQ